MTTQPKCPFCEKPVTLGAMMKSPLPSTVRCGHCREKISIQNVGLWLLAYCAFVVPLVVLVVITFKYHRTTAGVLVVVATAALEFGTRAVVLRRGTFVKPQGNKRETCGQVQSQPSL